MRLYLVRHAEAEDGDVDVERQLTDRGRADARRLAEALRPLELRVREIWHSGYPRAAQTAEPIAHEIAGAALKARDGLTPFDRTRPIAKEIKRFGGDLMIVGHEPFLGKLAARLVTGRAARAVVKLDKPSIVCIDDDDDASGEWRVRWMLSRDVTSPGQAPGVEARRGVDAATTPHGTDGPPA